MLSLQRLSRTLADYTLFPERVGDITTLVRYVYANTAETIDEIENIETMLAHYVSIEMETLMKFREIKDLKLEDGEVLSDFLSMYVLHMAKIGTRGSFFPML